MLTIDEKIQYIVERELARAIDDTHAEAGTVIVAEPAYWRSAGAGELAHL